MRDLRRCQVCRHLPPSAGCARRLNVPENVCARRWVTCLRSFHEPGDRLGGCQVRCCLDVGVVRRHCLIGVATDLAADLRVYLSVPRRAGG